MVVDLKKKMKCLLCNKNISLVIASKLRHGEKRNVYYCKECKLGILDTDLSEENLKKFYNKNYRNKFKPKLNKNTNPEELFNVYSNFQDERVKLVKKLITKKMRLLEIGCSAGMFLFHIKKYVKEIIGIDYDLKSAYFASRKCQCPIFNVDIEDTNLKKKSIDIVCMFQLLEHVKDPYTFIARVKKYLKDDGIIYIEVPNLCDILINGYNLINHRNFYFHSAHLWYFSEKSLRILLKKLGFIGQIIYTQDYNILNHMHWISVDTPQRDCIAGLSSPKLLFNKDFDADKKEKLNKFIQKMDSKYKNILAEFKMTSNISFIGRKKY